jgi:hypothetical protein
VSAVFKLLVKDGTMDKQSLLERHSKCHFMFFLVCVGRDVLIGLWQYLFFHFTFLFFLLMNCVGMQNHKGVLLFVYCIKFNLYSFDYYYFVLNPFLIYFFQFHPLIFYFYFKFSSHSFNCYFCFIIFLIEFFFQFYPLIFYFLFFLRNIDHHSFDWYLFYFGFFFV